MYMVEATLQTPAQYSLPFQHTPAEIPVKFKFLYIEGRLKVTSIIIFQYNWIFDPAVWP